VEPASFANGHVQGAINIPHGQMTASRMAEFPAGTAELLKVNWPREVVDRKSGVIAVKFRYPNH
jgi:hypothetical protein